MNSADPTQEVNALLQEGMHLLREVSKLCYATRAIEAQHDAQKPLQDIYERVQKLKEKVIESHNERAANALLSMEFMIEALHNELSMWITLKQDQADKAWNCLIVSQGQARAAMRADPVLASEMETYSKELYRLENVLFPPQQFVSSAHVIDQYNCSICGGIYGECGHVAGRPYMGQLCCRVGRNIIAVDHVALLDLPVDKRCRVTARMETEGWKDWMTWRILPMEDGEKFEESIDPKYGRFRMSILQEDGEPGT